ncbi:MAG: lipid-A-disaccharide synthase [Candidatus Brocadiia bacterium]
MKKIMIVAGETSADLHGSNLITALKSVCKEDIKVFGLGGPKMRAAGVELLDDITAYAGTGLDPLRNLARFSDIFRQLVHAARSNRPDLAILIDFPDFNLRLAKKLKAYGIKIAYYISPQVWAWRAGRINIIRKYVDKMLVLFEFEKEFYKRYDIDVEWVGHPLLDAIKPSPVTKQEIRRSLGLPPNGLVIGILPGSRLSEFRRHFPVIAKALPLIKSSSPVRYIMGAAPNITQKMINEYMPAGHKTDISVYYGRTYDVIRAADLLIAVSGTVTLEAAIMGAPMLVIYKVSLITELVLAPLVKIKKYSIVNIVAGKEVVPELIQRQASPRRIFDTVTELIKPGRLVEISQGLAEVKRKLGLPGASIRAANAIREMITGKV